MQTGIDYQHELNPAQYEAATTLEGPVLVIAGAGSGKTRTIVYRLVRLVESGVPASSILLLTFTRKAAQEMIDRARALLCQRGMPALSEYQETPPLYAGADAAGDYAGEYAAGYQPQARTHAVSGAAHGLAGVQGGTFHAYAYSVLRLFQPSGMARNLTVMDGHDIIAALQHCREETKAGKGDKSFPKNQTINGILSKTRNKEMTVEEVLRRESFHLLPHTDAIEVMGRAYAEFKRTKGLLDYDDLLFEFERLLLENEEALAYCRRKHQYIMLDEYQDTNPVQARIAGLVAGLSPAVVTGKEKQVAQFTGNLMVVGDDAQSIYAFRGADVKNILRFPEQFPGTKVIRLEENYRSTQGVLDVSNAILEKATEGYKKHLFTSLGAGQTPRVVRPLSDRAQAQLVASRILELSRSIPPSQIAVLFRAGFHSYALELELNKLGVRFKKYGGIRYTEAAHVKDVMSYIRLVQNPMDYTAFARVAELHKGVGSRTCLKIYQLVLAGDKAGVEKAVARFPGLLADLNFIDEHRRLQSTPKNLCTAVIDHYQPKLEELYPDDFPRRLQGLEQFAQLASAYDALDLFISDLALEDPLQEEKEEEGVVLSTIHSAKGLEWEAVIILDLVEERFPSRHSLTRSEDFEEERRLMYVACTRAKKTLEMYVPATLYDKGSGGSIPAVPSPFVRELKPSLYTEWQESYTGGLVQKKAHTPPPVPKPFLPRPAGAAAPTLRPTKPVEPEHTMQDEGFALGSGTSTTTRPDQCGYCHHKVFGRGKIIQHIPPDKYRVNFPGFGLKVIMAAYITLE